MAKLPIYWLDSPKRTADRVSISIDGQTYEFALEPHKTLFGTGFVSSERECVFRGYGISHNGSQLALTGCGGRMRGLLVDGASYYLIHPVHPRETTHVVHKRSADISEHHSCLFDAKDDPFPEDRFARSIFGGFSERLAQLRDEELTIELAVFADDTMWSHFHKLYGDDADVELHRFIVAVANNIDILFRHSTISPKVKVKIVKYDVLKMPPPSMSRNTHQNGDVDRLLESFCDYQHSINPADDSDPRHWDHALLFSGYDLYRDNLKAVAGYAPVKGMCTGIRSCTINEGLDFGSVFVVTHEMGHSLGMYHDGDNECDLRCCIMSPSVGTGKTEWSQCSVKELNVFVTRMGSQNRPHNCLRDDPLPEEETETNSIADSNVDLLPGQDYPINEQCTMFHGECWRHELRDGQTLEDVCEMVWCGNNEGIIRTAHPALEGTYCGKGKYCVGGKCVPTNSKLRPVNGQWSEWNEMSACGMGCSECAMQGQLRVRRSVRRCDSPSPNNGGNECSGSPLRAIRCHRRSCKGPSIEEFASDVCSKYRNHPTSPLLHLTGKGFQYEQAPCKIWCFMSRNNIRTIANFPDGTPCGESKYCVQGECMSLACNGKALTNYTTDCPLNPPELSAEEHSHSAENRTSSAEMHFGSWSAWSAWTDCTATLCNSFGVTQRTRNCPTDQCVGSPKQRAVCRGPPCTVNVSSEWTRWSSCSATCGSEGLRYRTKTNCKEEGFCIERQPCEPLPSCPSATVTSSAPPEAFKSAATPTGFISFPEITVAWSEWSPCNVSCGSGIQKRTQNCTSGPCPEQTRQCEGHDCRSLIGVWTSWAEWSPCSTTCGQGVKIRTRQCHGSNCPGMDRDMTLCLRTPCSEDNAQKSAKWRNWTLWSGCSDSCGGGLARRYRICDGFGCAGPATEYRHCGEQPCPSRNIA
uniref:Peptidase M12B domain-containing protein n=1 Tax=Steinernema glaseri TaxID=37863 RepID=A0A1I7Z0D3_9BILA